MRSFARDIVSKEIRTSDQIDLRRGQLTKSLLDDPMTSTVGDTKAKD